MLKNDKAPAAVRDLNYGKLNRSQKLEAQRIVLRHYFSRYDNTPADIAFVTLYKLSVVTRILAIHIVPGADLRALKKDSLK
ncbi:hypothetical protein [Nonlabens dokdonensis]|uniref:hypothetical protein n=1 Tax=Nonlabens dokdonensis TaxID=328515 RepID=UPI0026ED666D|nr:hypothetical protein [Nonlabens dokdonensis]